MTTPNPLTVAREAVARMDDAERAASEAVFAWHLNPDLEAVADRAQDMERKAEREAAEACIAYVRTLPAVPHGVVAEGFVLVPVEPTEAMIEATGRPYSQVVDTYARMLAAAPAAPVVPVVAEMEGGKLSRNPMGDDAAPMTEGQRREEIAKMTAKLRDAEAGFKPIEDGRAVAWLHQVVHCDDGEPDQALSFTPDNFPFGDTGLYRSLGAQPLYLAYAWAGLDRLQAAAMELIHIVEGPERYVAGNARLKDTPEWVRFYNAYNNAKDLSLATPADNAKKEEGK